MIRLSRLRYFIKDAAFIADMIGVPYANYIWITLQLSEGKPGKQQPDCNCT